MWTTPPEHPLRRLFAGITEHAFITSLGMADPPLIDYLSDLLSRFVHVDGVFRLRDGRGRPIQELAEMAMEAEKLPSEGRTRREYHRHIGDFALYWSGLFPEQVNRIQHRPCKDHLVSFAVLGKRTTASPASARRNGFRTRRRCFGGWATSSNCVPSACTRCGRSGTNWPSTRCPTAGW